MRAALLLLVAGCGFSAGGGQGPGDDTHVDASAEGSVLPAPDGPTPLDGAPSACPMGYAAIGGSRSQYRFVATGQQWSDAEAACEADSAHGTGTMFTHLAVLDDAAERTQLIAGHANLWIGADDLDTEGTVVWVTAQTQTYNVSNIPNADDKDCVRVKNMGTDEIRSCDEPNPFVCECDGFQPLSRSR